MRDRLQQLRQPGITGTADRQARAIAQNRDPAILRVQLDPRDPIDVEQVGSVDADEARRIERRLDRSEGLVLQILFALRLEADVVILRLDVLDPVHRQHVHL